MRIIRVVLQLATLGIRVTDQPTFCSKFLIARNMSSCSIPKFVYPTPRRDESVVDDYHGVKIVDPYRWMEDPDGEETKQFIEEQNAITKPFLDQCESRSEIHERLKKLWDFPKYSCPFQRGSKYYFFLNSGLQNQSVMYVQDTLESEPRVFLDPNELSEDGTVSLANSSFSEDGQIFAYGLSSCGSDWFTVHFKHVEKGDIYPEKLEKVKFTGLTWTHDNKGIFYGCYPDQEGKIDGSETLTNKNHKLFYHVLGTSQSEDVVVVDFPDEPEFIADSDMSYCGRYLIITVAKTTKNNLVYFSDLSKCGGKFSGKLDLVPIVTEFEADYEYITNTGPVAIFKTNKDAPNYRLVEINFENPAPSEWKDLVGEHKTDVLEWADAANDKYLMICYIRDVNNVLQVHSLENGELIKTFPTEFGTIRGYSGKRKYKDIFYQFSSFLTPSIFYRCDLSQPEMKPEIFREVKVDDFDREEFTTEQIFYESKDGTKIPMYIVYRKNLVRNGENPCLLYGYGGFNVSLLPSFSVTRLVFINNMDGVYAVPNLRGGGEYGDNWHKGGRLENKQNVFDDFHAAAEYLIKEKYTNSKRVIINGGSNGGLLVAACANQRPDLYGAAIAQVGVMDMLRFHKFTIGYFWVSDYGSSDNEKDFQVLLKYSPLHNIKVPEDESVQYPPTLLLTADHDDRVVPSHSLKFIAALQETFRNCSRQTNPLLIKIDTKAGHGGGKPTTKVIEEWTDVLSFLVLTLDLKFHS